MEHPPISQCQADVTTIRDGCYEEDGAPIKCWKCGCEKISEKVTDTLDVGVGRGLTMEFECICSQCGERVGYWAHGSYDPYFMMANTNIVDILPGKG